MDYYLLSEDELHESLAEWVKDQQRDHQLHTINLARFKKALTADRLRPCPRQGQLKGHCVAVAKASNGETACPRCHIQMLHDQTLDRLELIEAMLAASELPPAAVLKAAVERREARLKAEAK